MAEAGSEFVYRPTCGLIIIHHVFDAGWRRDRARRINAGLGGVFLLVMIAVYLQRHAVLDAVTLPQALGLLVLGWLAAAWLVEASIAVLCRPTRLFLRWPKPQRVSKTLEETWGDGDSRR